MPPSHLFVLGNASIDATLRVPSLPQPGETLMATSLTRSPGGKGLNQAVVAARAGAAVHFCAPVGPEPEAAIIPLALAKENLASKRLIAASEPTDLSTILVASNAENIIISTGACADSLTPYIAKTFARAFRPFDWLLIQGNLPEPTTWEAVSRAGHTIFNTAPIRWASPRIQHAAEIVIANAIEATQLTGLQNPADAIRALTPNTAIITLGAKGCLLFHANELTHHAAPEITATDTSGAGDVFCGVLAARITQGAPLETAIAEAQSAAALSATRPGCYPSFPTADELSSRTPAPAATTSTPAHR